MKEYTVKKGESEITIFDEHGEDVGILTIKKGKRFGFSPNAGYTGDSSYYHALLSYGKEKRKWVIENEQREIVDGIFLSKEIALKQARELNSKKVSVVELVGGE